MKTILEAKDIDRYAATGENLPDSAVNRIRNLHRKSFRRKTSTDENIKVKYIICSENIYKQKKIKIVTKEEFNSKRKVK